MNLRTLTVFFLAFAAPSVVRCEPITYRLAFSGTGSFTPYGANAQPVPIAGPVILTMRNDTTNVRVETDGDGDPIGFQTNVPNVAILVPGVVNAVSTPVRFLSPTGGSQEIFQDQITPLSLTFVFSVNGGDYDLKSNLSTPTTVTVNYFNMGVLVTSKGIIRLNPETINGIFTGKLKSAGNTEPF